MTWTNRERRLLAGAPVLGRLPKARLDAALARAERRTLRAGETLFREGDAADGVYLILSGYLGVTRDLWGNGPQLTLGTRGPGDWIGDLSLQRGERRSANAVAESAVVLLALSRTGFVALLREVPEAAIDLVVAIGERLRASDTALVEAVRKQSDDLQAANRRLSGEVRRLRRHASEAEGFEDFAGTSHAAARIRAAARRAAEGSRPVLLRGEAGTGKHLLARLIHQNGERRSARFLALSPSSLPESALEAELFGYARAAVSGAGEGRAGLVEQARGGTLYLEDVDRLPLAVQAQLVRLVDGREYQRVGESRVREAEVRVVASLQSDGARAVREGRLRETLLQRLAAVTIDLPPLRERRRDLTAIAAALSAEIANDRGAPLLRWSRPALRVLASAELRANADDLRAELLRLYGELPPGATVELADLHPDVVRGERVRYGDALRGFKLELIGEAMREAGGNASRAAERLGLHPSNLHRMLREVGLAGEVKRGRPGPRKRG